ncbi:MAG: glutamine synthetase III [Bacteroidales bacterium]|nr:glutamine synthetase III [Bacteroidales bacterium]
MHNLRLKALELLMTRQPKKAEVPHSKISEYFGELTFGLSAMREYLTSEANKSLVESVHRGQRIKRLEADQVAAALKSWAISRGVTHYTHWFHPLTGATAEKHDAFIVPSGDGKAIENLTGGELVQQEPDASSFPSGGIRNTFEARGYTAWDPTSPAFIIDRTLCVPTIFISYTGEALDFKLPLLKTLSEIDSAATAICKYFSDDISNVHSTLGWEQEYFVVDEALYQARPDMMLTGRTVFGHASAKDQQLSDHYFGVIPSRVMEFMKEFEYESHRLGIPVKTRHNEVAPNQFELAPVYEEVNLAVDHNQLVMHIMQKVARRHNLRVLLHEKPFAKVNGSGKHNNWSLATDTGINLLSPGKDVNSNFRFLTFMAVVLKAVYKHADLLRGAIASAGNDLRLGAHEAPPAIISVFIGSHLSQVFDELEKYGTIKDDFKSQIDLKLSKIPEIKQDNTDRNRTSPFAFTGNKFEFRAVGSAQNCSSAMIALNLIVADQLKEFKKTVDELISNGTDKDKAIFQIVQGYISDSKLIRFEGNNYSDEWIKEAESRGLSNLSNSVDALRSYVSEKTIRLFEQNGILTERELYARYYIKLENYIKVLQIEARVMGDLATNHIIPTAIRYQNTLIENVKGLKDVLDNKTFVNISRNQITGIKAISDHINQIRTFVDLMTEERKKANNIEDLETQSEAYLHKVLPYFDQIRYHVDKLEVLVDDEIWPLPKYRELLFSR